MSVITVFKSPANSSFHHPGCLVDLPEKYLGQKARRRRRVSLAVFIDFFHGISHSQSTFPSTSSASKHRWSRLFVPNSHYIAVGDSKVCYVLLQASERGPPKYIKKAPSKAPPPSTSDWLEIMIAPCDWLCFLLCLYVIGLEYCQWVVYSA